MNAEVHSRAARETFRFCPQLGGNPSLESNLYSRSASEPNIRSEVHPSENRNAAQICSMRAGFSRATRFFSLTFRYRHQIVQVDSAGSPYTFALIDHNLRRHAAYRRGDRCSVTLERIRSAVTTAAAFHLKG